MMPSFKDDADYRKRLGTKETQPSPSYVDILIGNRWKKQGGGGGGDISDICLSDITTGYLFLECSKDLLIAPDGGNYLTL